MKAQAHEFQLQFAQDRQANDLQAAAERAPGRSVGRRAAPQPFRRAIGRRIIAIGARVAADPSIAAGSLPMIGTSRPLPRQGDRPLTVMTREMKASFAFIERNFHLTRRYWAWEIAFLVYSVAGALSISLIGEAQGDRRLLFTLMIGAIFWNYLSVTFSWIAETIAVERWEGTLEYTMMAPIRRSSQLVGSVAYAIVYGLVHTAAMLIVLCLFFGLDLSHADLAGGRGDDGHRLDQLRRDRDARRDPAAPLRGARGADDVRPPVGPAPRERGLLPDLDPARLDAGARAPVAGDVHPRRRPGRPHRGRRASTGSWATSGRSWSWPSSSSRSACGASGVPRPTPSGPAS